MSKRTLTAILMLLSLTACSSFERGGQCPQPSPELLLPVPPLAGPGQAPAVTQQAVIVQYVDDIGRFETLRVQHAELQNWMAQYCLAGK